MSGGAAVKCLRSFGEKYLWFVIKKFKKFDVKCEQFAEV